MAVQDTASDNNRRVTCGWSMKILTGWRASLYIQSLIVFVVLIVNIIVLLWANLSHFEQVNGIITLYSGSCETTHSITKWSHFGINILGTLMLSASDSCMHCLTAPTRDEVNASHARGSWLNIGVLSFRNLKSIRAWRIVLWVCLVVSSLPLHLFYNSVMVSSLSANDYFAFIVAPNFFTGGPTILPNHSYISSDYVQVLMAAQSDANNALLYTRLDNDACLKEYSKNFVADFQNVLVVLDKPTVTNTLVSAYQHSPETTNEPAWPCEGIENLWSHHVCDYRRLIANTATWNFTVGEELYTTQPIIHPSKLHSRVDHCLAQKTAPKCTVQLSRKLMLIVIACNVVKLACLLTCILVRGYTPLVTVGDGLLSFLYTPDEATLSKGPLSHADVHKTYPWSVEKNFVNRPWKSSRRMWAGLISKTQWAFTIFCISGVWIAALVLLHVASNDDYTSMNPTYAFSLGFGTITLATIWRLTTDLPLTSLVIISNLPQLLVSFLYLMYNNVLTRMLSANELNDFGRHKKSLRVSEPQGEQRSTYWLQLPYRWAIPPMIGMGVLHWFVSQSLFLARVHLISFDGSFNPKRQISGCCWSAAGIVASLALGGVMTLGLVGLGFMRLKPGMPVLSNCSLTLSAACHPTSMSRGQDVALKPIQYGVLISTDNSVKHCGFDNKVIGPLLDKRVYC